MDNNLTQKQTYLRIQILEAGLDGGEFMQYLTNINPKKGHQLNLWTYEELVGVVDAFKKTKLPLNPYIYPQISTIGAQSTNNPQKNVLDDNLYNQKVKCEVKQVNGVFGSCDSMKIKVTKFQKVQGGMFERSYINYTIQVPYLKTIVSRRYSEFVWLRDTLMLLYPGLPIPPVAKKSKVARFQDKYLNKKMYILQKFMNTLIKIKEICSDVIFQKFLTILDLKQYQKFKSQYAKIGSLPISKIKTIEGTVSSSTDKQIVTKLSKYDQYLKQTQPQIKKIYKNFKGAATNLQMAGQFLKSVGSNCKFLRKKQQLLRVDLQLPAIQQNSIFLMLQNFSSQYASSLLQHARSFRKELYSMAKYQSLYRINMVQTIQQLNLKQAEYLRVKTELLKKKEKLFAQGKVSKWGAKEQVKPNTKQEAFAIMLPKQTAELLQIRQTYGMYNSQFFEQCLRHTRDLNKDLSLYIRQFIEMQFRYVTDSSIMLDKIVAKTREVEVFHNNT